MFKFLDYTEIVSKSYQVYNTSKGKSSLPKLT